MAGKSGCRSRWRWLLLPPALLLGLWIPGNVAVTVTPSVRRRIFWLTAPRYHLADGDYLLFEMKDPWSGRARDRIIKEIGCAPGEMLENRGPDYYCDGRFLGRALAADSTGAQLPRFVFHGRVPADRFFMMGDHPRSYDSKYFGFISRERIRARAVPLL